MSPERAAGQDGGAEFTSIVVPARRGSATVADCVAGLLAQDHPRERFEIVVVENGPPQGGPPAVLPGSDAPPALRVLSLPRADANAARNAGARAARGDLICFVDDDAVVPSGWLSAVTAGVTRHPEAACWGGPIRPRFESAAPRTCPAHVAAGTVFERGESDVEVPRVWGANLIVPRRSFERVGPFREGLRLEQEWEWQWRLTASGGAVVYLADAWLWHRLCATDLRLDRQLGEQFRRGFTRGRLHPPPDPSRVLARELAHGLAHGVAARCARGLTDAARSAGFLLARVSSRRADAG